MDIKFHCDEASNFKRQNQYVRAFSYREYSIEPHNHDFYEINIVLGGSGRHKIEGSSFLVERGDVFVIPPQVVHAYDNSEHLEIYHILIKKAFINRESEGEGIPGFMQFMEIEPFLRIHNGRAMNLRLSPMQITEISKDFKFIEDPGEFSGEGFSPLCNHTAKKIIYYLSYLFHKQLSEEGKSNSAKYKKQILNTLEYVNSNFQEKLTVDILAERVFLSRSTFLRSFGEFCGCSPMEYLIRYRRSKAIELAETTTMSKTEIAHFCGFYDLSHMERSLRAGRVRR